MSDIRKKYGWLISNLNPHDETFEEMFPSLLDGLHHDKRVCIERKHPVEINSYLGFKNQLETLLTERNLDEIEKVILESENGGTYPQEKSARQKIGTWHIRVFERIYYEIFHEDSEFKSELVHTPVEKLLEKRF
mgnify:CR=1 FL=1